MTRAARIGVLAAVLATGCRVDTEVGSNLLVRDAAPPDADLPACLDNHDNDGDGLADFPDDPGCADYLDADETDPAVPPACWNRADDDTDLVIDFPLERGCLSAADNDETDPATPPECSDGIDNDGNGDTDYPDDEGCYAAGDTSEYIVTN